MQEARSGASPEAAAVGGVGTWSEPFVILGQTFGGKPFRPSDWAERLAGVMAAFQPKRSGGQRHLAYSPYVLPSSHRGISCVVVDPRLRELEPMAFAFMVNFATDNELATELLSREPDLAATSRTRVNS